MRRFLLSWIVVPAGVLLSLALLGRFSRASTTAISQGFPNGIDGIVFTQISMDAGHRHRSEARAMLSGRWGEGGRLMLLQPDGATRILTQEFDSAADPSVAFDGTKILFAGKKSRGAEWNIFEMAADGSGVRQLTHNLGNCRKPIYQSALFYLNDARPSYQLAFESDVDGELNAPGVPATNLYSMRFDGTGLRRLTYGILSSFDPWQMQDGRILFSHWEVNNREDDPRGRIDLFGVSLDGTDFAAFSGMQGLRIKHMACVTPDGHVVFVETNSVPWDGAGRLGILNLRRNLHSYQPGGDMAEELFHSPSPLPDSSILVSIRPADGGGTHSIYRMDLGTLRSTLIFGDANYHNIQAVALVARPEPDGHSSVVEDDKNWSQLYGLNVYESDLKREWLPPGTAARIRVLEGLPRKAANTGSDSGGDSGWPVRMRLLGDVRLDEDSSFHLSVPPNIPIQLQLLDSDGMALRTSAWIWTKNKENRGCIGCHEDGERTPENVFAQALSHPAAELTLPPERRRMVDFRHDVMPVLDARCSQVSCHGTAAHPLFARVAGESGIDAAAVYERLLAFRPVPRMEPERRMYVDPGRARTSPLIWAILGRNTARPWDASKPTTAIKPMPPAGSTPLTDVEKQAIIEWVDFGASFSALPAHRGEGR